MPSSGSGSFGSSASSVPATSSATASALTQFRSAGTTYHGADSVDVSVEGLLPRGDPVVELLAHLQVVAPELPALLGVVDPLLEPHTLLVARDVEEHLEHRRALVDEHLLERADVLVAAAPDLLRRELEHPHGDDVLVVRAVEHADRAPTGKRGVDAPQVVVLRAPRRPAP